MIHSKAVLALCLGFLCRAQTSPLEDQIVAQERAQLECLKTGDLTTFASLIADDAVFVDSQGAAGKADIVKHTAEFRLHEYSMTVARFVPLSADSGLIAYDLVESGNSQGREFTAQVHVSALWVLRAGKWLSVFRQETAAR